MATPAKPEPRVAAPIPANRPQNIEMPVEEWFTIPDNPRQRDTERHAQKAKHLLTPSPTHRRVAMAQSTTDERQWKLDGHTRALFWQRRQVQPPRTLNVAIYYVSSELEAAELYTQFDAPEAVETAADKVFGAYQALGYQPQSKYLKMFGINSAVRIAQGIAEGARVSSKASIYRLIGDWLGEIRRFDAINPDHKRFTANLLAAALVTFRKYPEDSDAEAEKKGEPTAFGFWTRYNDDAGEKITLEDDTSAMDAVEALSRFMLSARGGMGARHAVMAGRYDVIGKALAAVETFKRKGFYTRGFAKIDETKYLTD
jgi:hypothetical protein